MFEQAYGLEYEERSPRDSGDASTVSLKSLQLAMPLISICNEQNAMLETDAADAIFGNAWPGLAVAFG